MLYALCAGTCQAGRFSKIHHQIRVFLVAPVDFGTTLAIIKVLDARRRGATTEAYRQYAAGRSDRRQHRR